MSESVSPSSPEILRLTRGVVSYLQEQVRSSRRQVRDAVGDNKVHWFVDVIRQGESSDLRALLEVEPLPSLDPPVPPPTLQRWLDPEEWTQPKRARPRIKARAGWRSPDTPVPEEVLRTYDVWVEGWQQWADQERELVAHRTWYAQLEFLERETLQRIDTHELVVGVGLLSAYAEERWSVRRHLLTWSVSIDRDEQSDVLRLMLPVDVQARVEDRGFLNAGDGFNLRRGRSPWHEEEISGLHPFSSDAVRWLEDWKKRCWDGPLGLDAGRWAPPEAGDDEVAQLALAPALFLRERDRSGLAGYYDAIAESLDKPEAGAPLGLAQLVTDLDAEQRQRWLRESAPDARAVVSADPLLPLATNGEQRRVLDKLRADTAVVVQGPPGTGKTHTIANLICALLADGQRLLITSEKDQALRVLRDQLPPEVRQLCVLLTGMRRGAADELDRSVTALSELSAATSVEQLQFDIERLRQRRVDLGADLRQALRDLQSLREQEYLMHPALARPYSGTLADLARSINAHRDRYAWIDSLPPHAPDHPPLTGDDARQLLELLRTETPERRLRADQHIPGPELVPTPSQISALATALAAAERVLGPDRQSTAWALAGLSDTALVEIERHVDAAADALADCGLPDILEEWDASDWRLTAVQALLGRRNPAYWNALFEEINEIEVPLHALASLDGTDVDVGPRAGNNLKRLLGQAKRLRAHLARGRRLRRFLPPQVQLSATDLLQVCTVDGVPPATAAELTTLITVLEAEIAVSAALNAWNTNGVPVVHGPLRRRIAQLDDIAHNVTAIKKLITAREAIEQLLRRQGVRHAIRSAADWDFIVGLARNGPVIAAARQAAADLEATTEALDAWSDQERAAPEIAELVTALVDRDLGHYASARARLDEARTAQAVQNRCDSLADWLARAHPSLAERLNETLDDPSWSERFGEFPQAWAWATAVAYHRVARQGGADELYQQRVDETEQRLREVTADLAGKQALLHCLASMTERQRKALQSYRTAMGAYGQGQGRHKERQLAAARDAMREARRAVPAWVMQLSIVAESIPPEPNAFDVVIVDEASQAGIDALFLLWLAPRIIVVGDDKQCAPGRSSTTGLKTVEESLDHHLPGLPLHLRNSLSPTSNLYELLSTHFPDVVRLSEHFRSMPEIIGWSSAQFYDSRLVPLRQFGADRLDPLKVVPVDGAEEGRDASLRNRVEAERVIEQVQKIIEDPMYSGKSIGIIALQNGKQVQVLESLLTERIDPADIRKHRVRAVVVKSS